MVYGGNFGGKKMFYCVGGVIGGNLERMGRKGILNKAGRRENEYL